MTSKTRNEVVNELNKYIEQIEKEFPSLSEEFDLSMLLDQIAVTIIYLRQSFAILSLVGQVAEEYLNEVTDERSEQMKNMKVKLGNREL